MIYTNDTFSYMYVKNEDIYYANYMNGTIV
jgi:hypothetical protein